MGAAHNIRKDYDSDHYENPPLCHTQADTHSFTLKCTVIVTLRKAHTGRITKRSGERHLVKVVLW